MKRAFLLVGLLALACASQVRREVMHAEPVPGASASAWAPAASARQPVEDEPAEKKTVELVPPGLGVVGLLAHKPLMDENGQQVASGFEYTFTAAVGEGTGTPPAPLVVAALLGDSNREDYDDNLVVRQVRDGKLVLDLALETTTSDSRLDNTFTARKAKVDEVNQRLAAWRFRALTPCKPDDPGNMGAPVIGGVCDGMGRVEIHQGDLPGNRVNTLQASRATLQTPRRRHSWSLRGLGLEQPRGTCDPRATALSVVQVLADPGAQVLAIELENTSSGCCSGCTEGHTIRGLLAPP